MLHTIEDILAKGDKLVLLGFFTVEPKFYKEKKPVSYTHLDVYKRQDQDTDL